MTNPIETIRTKLTAIHDQLLSYVGHHAEKGADDKAATNERFRHMALDALAALDTLAAELAKKPRFESENACADARKVVEAAPSEVTKAANALYSDAVSYYEDLCDEHDKTIADLRAHALDLSAVPSGWRVFSIDWRRYQTPEATCVCFLARDQDQTMVKDIGPTPSAALSAAIERAKEAGA